MSDSYITSSSESKARSAKAEATKAKGSEKAESAERAREARPLAEYDRSGDMDQDLYVFPSGSHVNRATVRIRGDAFRGRLKFLKGVTVSPSPMVYTTDGKPAAAPASGEKAFIIDFGGLRSILGLSVAGGAVTVVLPWLGTQFAEKPIYPVEGQFVPVETPKLLVQFISSGTLDLLEKCTLTTGTCPMNLKASINDRPPFWTHPGVLSGEVEVAGLEKDLNTLLKDAGKETRVVLHLATDMPGVLSVDFDPDQDLDFDLANSALWGNESKLDVRLQALESREVTLCFPAKEAKAWKIGRLALALSGKFPSWRGRSGQTTVSPGKIGMKVNAQLSVARRFVFEEAGELFGFSIPLRSLSDTSELRIEVLKDQEGQPGREVIATADLAFPAATSFPSPWTDILFPSSSEIEQGKGMWLAVKAKKGAVEWIGSPETGADLAATLYNSEGGRWQSYPSVSGNRPVAQIRVLRSPFVKESEPLLGIVWNWKGSSKIVQSIELAEDPTKVELELAPAEYQEAPPEGGSVSIPLTVSARSSGTLTIKGAIAFRRR